MLVTFVTSKANIHCSVSVRIALSFIRNGIFNCWRRSRLTARRFHRHHCGCQQIYGQQVQSTLWWHFSYWGYVFHYTHVFFLLCNASSLILHSTIKGGWTEQPPRSSSLPGCSGSPLARTVRPPNVPPRSLRTFYPSQGLWIGVERHNTICNICSADITTVERRKSTDREAIAVYAYEKNGSH